MTQISAIAKNYAKALFCVAKSHNNVDKISAELEIFRKNFNEQFANELKNPAISKDDSVKIITQIGKKLNFSEIFLNFLANMSKNRRLGLFGDVYKEFSRLLRIEKNILEIELISSAKLDESTIEDIKKIIAKQNPNKSIEVIETLKSDILGGLQIKIGSNLIDASLRNKLSLIEKELVAIAA